MSTQTLEKKPKQDSPKAQQDATAKAQPPKAQVENYLMPPVTIFEDDEQVTLQADLPGVTKDRVHLHCEQGGLTLEGELALDLNSGNDSTKAIQVELPTPRFRRSFVIGNELDTQAIKASMEDGVLTVRIPKKPSARPFKIAID